MKIETAFWFAASAFQMLNGSASFDGVRPEMYILYHSKCCAPNRAHNASIDVIFHIAYVCTTTDYVQYTRTHMAGVGRCWEVINIKWKAMQRPIRSEVYSTESIWFALPFAIPTRNACTIFLVNVSHVRRVCSIWRGKGEAASAAGGLISIRLMQMSSFKFSLRARMCTPTHQQWYADIQKNTLRWLYGHTIVVKWRQLTLST